MQLPSDIGLQQRLQKWSKYLAALMIIIALMKLLGWQLDIAFLKDPFSSEVFMNPVSAIAFILSGLSMWLYAKFGSSYSAYILALLVLLVGLTRFIGHVFDLSFQIDTIFFTDTTFGDQAADTGKRMAPNAALCFILTGLCLIFSQSKTLREKNLSDYAALLITLICLYSLLGYLYRVESFYGFLSYIPMAAPTAICFLFFALSILFAEPGKGIMKEFTSTLSGSLMFRLLIPAVIIIPSAIGLLRLYGNWGGLYNTEFGATIFVLTVIVLFGGITWYNAVLLNRRDMLRIESEEAFRDSEKQKQAIFNNAPDAVVVVDSYATIIRWNPVAEQLFGWKKEEAIGKTLNDIIVPPRFKESHIKGMQIFRDTGQSKILGKTVDLKAVKKILPKSMFQYAFHQCQQNKSLFLSVS